jgi:hypothetical protein
MKSEIVRFDCGTPDVGAIVFGFSGIPDMVASYLWGQTKSTADVTADGIVDVSDLLMVVSSWGAV